MGEKGGGTALCMNKRGCVALAAACALLVMIVCARQNLLLALCAWNVFLCAALLSFFLFGAGEKRGGGTGAGAANTGAANAGAENHPAARRDDAARQPAPEPGRREMLDIPPFEAAGAPSRAPK